MADEQEQIQSVDVLDASYPLLVLMREKAPGTYSHGKNVASLLEALSVELKLNTQYLRIAGYYHDIGKIVNPEYFIENQFDEPNPHDSLDPYLSKMIISSHVGNSVQILINDQNMPVEVIRWCSQHHGNSLMRYFFDQAGGNPEDFRYCCSKPDSLEPGLLMLCDNLDATCKSISQKGGLTDVASVVSKTFEDLMQDGQLDNVGVPGLSYIRIIKEVLTTELKSMYQSKRIDYDEVKKQKPKPKQNEQNEQNEQTEPDIENLSD